MKWDARTKLLWHKIVLCGGKVEQRSAHLGAEWERYYSKRWYLTVPPALRKDYVMGPYATKSEAVLRCAELMEIL